MPALPCGPLTVVVALVAITVFAFWPSIAALAELWSHPERRTYQHGYVITAIALWVIYRERKQITVAVGPPRWLLFVAAVLGAVAWLVALRAGLQVVHMLLWPAVLWCALAGVLGWRAGRVLLFPVGYLYFGIPVWDALTPALQWATIAANQLMTSLTGVPALIEGNEIHIPAGSFVVEGGCSGLNYLLAGIAVGALLGEVNQDRLQRRILLVVLAAGMAIFSNWVRVYIVILAGHLTDMQHYLVRVNHYDFGWVLFAFVLVGYFLLVRRLPDAGSAATPVVPQESATVSVPAAFLVMATLAVLGAGRSVRLVPDVRYSVGIEAQGPVAVPGWDSEITVVLWKPEFPGADGESLTDYYRGSDRVTSYRATYLHQGQGRELIGHGSMVQGPGLGHMAASTRVTLPGDPPVELAEGEWREQLSDNRYLLWWTYQVGTRNFGTGLPAQVWYGVASLWSEPLSTVVVLRAQCLPDCGEARRILREFAAAGIPRLLAVSGPGPALTQVRQPNRTSGTNLTERPAPERG